MTTMTRAAAVTQSVQGASEKTRSLMTRLNLYYTVVAALVLVNLYLLAQIAFTFAGSSSKDATALAQQTVAMKTAEIAKKPLEGLDGKLTASTADADKFYETRLPSAYSDVLAELGVLTTKQGVKLKSVQYAQAPVLYGSVGVLTEIRMDAVLNGDYRPLVLFVNSLERDKMFFLISGVTLTGQQSGTVGLRLKLTTYLRPSNGESAPAKKTTDAPASSSAKDGSGSR
jgi:type IV pilus assembly protein PilO